MSAATWTMPRDMSGFSALEAAMLAAIHATGLPEPVAEHPFDWCCPHSKARHRREGDWSAWCEECGEENRRHYYRHGRNWRFDFAWPEYMVAVECEGGTWSSGRHTRGAGFAADAEKYNAAMLAGWMVLRFVGEQIEDGRAIQMVEAALRPRTEVDA